MKEHDEQKALFEWYHNVALLRWPDMVMYANPNAAKMSFGAARWMSAEGRTKGIPDITIANPRGRYGAFYVEMKSEKGRVSQEQEDMMDRLFHAGNNTTV